MRDFILIHINGQRHEIRSREAFQTLSTYLRETLHLAGTKIVCSEGDCGSCSVLIGRVANGKMQYRPVCSCIQSLAQLDCTHIITVEGLADANTLNPLQESMVKHHGAQCGFCTPGFVVNMCSLLDEKPAPTDHDLRRALTGNLCRCTGYQSIIDAGRDVPANSMTPLAQRFDSAKIAADLTQHQNESVQITSGADARVGNPAAAGSGLLLFKPTTLAAAIAFKAAHPACTILSGGTDLGVQVNKGLRELRTILAISAIPELQQIQSTPTHLSVGAAVSLTDYQAAATAAIPEISRLLEWFGSPPIRHAGTLGGNIANASPIGDTMPALYVLNAQIELTGTAGPRLVNINDFYAGYKKTVATPDELISRVVIPIPQKSDVFKLYKVSKRKDLDISAFTAAIRMQLSAGIISDVRLAFGGVGPNILRLPQTEARLKGQPLSETLLQAAGQIARSEVRPISDMRGSADYRLQLAENILLKFFHELPQPTSSHSINSFNPINSLNSPGAP